MGVFCDYLGDMNIPDELKDEFNKNMITLLQRGGMMKFEKVSLFGKELSLLKPLEEDEEGKIHFFTIISRMMHGNQQFTILKIRYYIREKSEVMNLIV